MPLYTYQDAEKLKELLERLKGKEHEIIEYYGSGKYYVREKTKKR